MKRAQTEHKSISPKAQRLQASRDLVQAVIKEHPNNIRMQIVQLYAKWTIYSSIGRARPVSSETHRKYQVVVNRFIDALSERNIVVHNLNELTYKHVKIFYSYIEDNNYSSSTVTSYFAALRKLFTALNKHFVAKSPKELVNDQDKAKRQFSTTTSKSWSSQCVNIVKVFREIEGYDKHVGMYLKLCWAFGLRVKEAVSLRPTESFKGNALYIELGAKGGRGRIVEFDTPYQEVAIKEAMAMQSGHQLRRHGRSVEQELGRFYYVLRKFGVTKKQMGVTAHGLRHEYAHAIYEQLAGVKAPVLGGLKPEQTIDHEARQRLSNKLGHNRIAVTSAYTGTVVHIERDANKRLQALAAKFGTSDLFKVTCEKAVQAYVLRAELASDAQVELQCWVLGDEALGKDPQSNPLVLGVEVSSKNGMPLALEVPAEILAVMGSALTPFFARPVAAVSMRAVTRSHKELEVFSFG